MSNDDWRFRRPIGGWRRVRGTANPAALFCGTTVGRTAAQLVEQGVPMCGRYGLTRTPWKLAERLGVSGSAIDAFDARYNIAPTQRVLAISNERERPVVELRWGLIPYWAESPSAMKLSTFNARIETISTAPAYRGPTRSRRCVIFADGFYEWRRGEDGAKTPYWIHRVDGEPFVFAGLWDRWRARQPGQDDVASCTIVTAAANEFMQPVHTRMPVVLAPSRADAWLVPEPLAPADALDILIPDEESPTWEMYAVSARVGNVRNEDPSLTQPVPA